MLLCALMPHWNAWKQFSASNAAFISRYLFPIGFFAGHFPLSLTVAGVFNRSRGIFLFA
jgi:hypothetical protein